MPWKGSWTTDLHESLAPSFVEHKESVTTFSALGFLLFFFFLGLL